MMELAERPNHPFVLFNLGMTYDDMGDYEQSIQWLERCLAVSHEHESHLRKAYAILIGCYSRLKRMSRARELCSEALNKFPEDAEILFRSAALEQEEGRLNDAEATYRRILNKTGERHFQSIDRGIVSFKLRQNLAVLYAEKQDWARAELHFRAAIASAPTFQPAWSRLGELLLQQRRLVAAQLLAEQASEHDDLRCFGAILTAQVMQAQGDIAGARESLSKASETYRDDLAVLEARCRLEFHHGSLDQARDFLSELAAKSPDDGAVHHNLGTVYLRMNSWENAANAYRDSLRVRPNSVDTHEQLATALESLGRNDECQAARTRGRRLSESRTALGSEKLMAGVAQT
jgi:tetratricopeptide (TPR) repeat protein